jgi:sugar lactone lactonase YvrE/energy-coupling factor transporter ATP-binding protein EcfA2
VFQDPSLFSGTIRENIAYAKPHASVDDVVAAARSANAAEFITRFAHGYGSQIGERGIKLSGGQKQRIAAACAILKDAPILILDEATRSLDSTSERLVQEGLEHLLAGRTTVIIARRLSTISSVDRIITLRDGRVDEIGTPERLAATGGIYAELLALQASSTTRGRAAPGVRHPSVVPSSQAARRHARMIGRGQRRPLRTSAHRLDTRTRHGCRRRNQPGQDRGWTSMTMWADQSVTEVTAEQVTGPVNDDAACPVWDARTRSLRYVDVGRSDVVMFHPQTGLVERQHVRDGAVALRQRSGGWALVERHAVVALDERLRPEGRIVAFPDERGQVTDAEWGPNGSLYVLSLRSGSGVGELSRLRADGHWEALVEGLTDPRGISFDPVGRRLYLADGPDTILEVEPDASSRVTEPRPWVAVEAHGTPYGTAIDTQGGVWVALLGGSAVLRYTADGALDQVVHVPTSQVTGCVFGGADLEDLYVTTSTAGLDWTAESCAGSLFRARPGAVGVPRRSPLPTF